MDKLTRRDLLRGRLRDESPAPSAPSPIVVEGRSLPSVISWLDPEMAATPRRPEAGTPLLLRPPGAIEEREFLAACTRCGDCAEACPPGAIGSADARTRDAEGTPIVDPSTSPCLLCDGFPCIAACETGALRSEAPAALGTARVQVLDCLNRLGTSCSVCVERCPVPEAMTWLGDVPVVDERLCTGCGICQHTCPAPQNAILLLPNPERPTAAALALAAAPQAEELELPDLHEAELDEAGLCALFRDLSALAEIQEIRLKQAARARASDTAPTPESALELLRSGAVRGVQIVYRYRDETWCDTLLPTAAGHRVVRMAMSARPVATA